MTGHRTMPSSVVSPSKRAKTTTAGRDANSMHAGSASTKTDDSGAGRGREVDDDQVVDLVSDDDGDNADAVDTAEIRALLREHDLPVDVVDGIAASARGDAARALDLAARALEEKHLRDAMAESLRNAEEDKQHDERAREEWKLRDPLSYYGDSSRFIASCSEAMMEILFPAREDADDDDEASKRRRRETVIEFLDIERKCGVWFSTFKAEVIAYFEKLADEIGAIARSEEYRGDLAPDRADVVFDAFAQRLEFLKREIFTMPEQGAAGAVPAIFRSAKSKGTNADDDDVRIAEQKLVAKRGANVDVCDLT